jgi:hypothetical protein
MAEITILVNSIGSLAQKIISEEKTAILLGVSSRGIFLKVGLHWVIFLSCEPMRGPLTLNLNQPIPATIGIAHTQSIEIETGRIYFPTLKIEILTGGAREWSVTSPSQHVLNLVERNEGIIATLREIINQRGGIGLAPVLAELLDIDFCRQPNLHALVNRSDMLQVVNSLRSSDVNPIIAHLRPFLGRGFGLTPSGDDMIGGLLLTLNRYRETLHPPFSLSSVNKAVVELAYTKTSLLSANLIECASLGQADKRLILALDGLMTGVLNVASCANLLLNWGNSSGCDALVGMALATLQTL